MEVGATYCGLDIHLTSSIAEC